MLQLQPVCELRFSLLVHEKGLEEEAEELKEEIKREVQRLIHIVDQDEKTFYRYVHQEARNDALEKHREWLKKNWSKYSNAFANPCEVVPNDICPRLELVEKQRHNDLFRIARLTWSLPYSRGYGRRLDYLLWDESNGKLMGVLGMQSAPISFPARDRAFHMPYEKKIELVNQTMDAYTLGALPPYQDLLAGKLLVLAAAPRDVRMDYERRYQGRVTKMQLRVLPSSLIAVTTLSAFGRSSLYNRVSKGRNGKQNIWAALSLGPCEGWGTIHFSDELYQRMKAFQRKLRPEKRLSGFGTGPKIRQQVVKRTLRDLRLPENFGRHNIGREVFIIPHIENLREILAGEDQEPVYSDQPFDELATFWKERYCLPRSTARGPLKGCNIIPAALGLTE